jgi:hypothetical protein
MKRKKYNTNIRRKNTKTNIMNVFADWNIPRKTKKESMPPKIAIPQVISRRRLHICQVPGRSKLLQSDSVTSKALPIVLEA